MTVEELDICRVIDSSIPHSKAAASKETSEILWFDLGASSGVSVDSLPLVCRIQLSCRRASE